MGTESVLLGRDTELAELERLLAAHRLVTITGVGGVGKTSLAEAAARAVADRATCLLLRHFDPHQVPCAVAESAGYASWEAALVALADRRLLLVLDNCEHVLDASAEVVESLLAEAPGVRVLATSREPLAVPGEHVLRLAPLELAAGSDPADVAASPAVQLFLARAAAAGAPMNLDAALAADVAELCRRLDGLPLAIELAAARAPTLAPAEITAHLDRRLELLVGSRRAPARHRSLAAMVDWSYERLEPDTARFFDWIGVRKGLFTVEAAHAVGAASGEDLMAAVDHLDRLVSRSLVQTSRREGRTWYELLETLQDYARERLTERGELDAAIDRGVNWTVSECMQIRERSLRSWSTELAYTTDALRHDVHDALSYVLERDADPERAFRLYVPLWRTVGHTGRADAVATLGDRLLARWPEETVEGWPEVAATAATAHVATGELARAGELARRALAHAQTPLTSFVAARALLLASVAAQDAEPALRLAAEAAEIARAHGLLPWRIEVETLRAIALSVRAPADALAVARAAHADARATDSPAVLAWCGLVHAHVLALTDRHGARALLAEVLAGCEGYPRGRALALRGQAALDLADGRPATGAHALRSALETFVANGLGTAHVRSTLRWVAALATVLGRDAEAAELRTAAGTAPGQELGSLLARATLPAEADHPQRPDEPAECSKPLRQTLTLARAVLAAAAQLTDPAPADALPDHGPGGGSEAGVFRREGGLWVLTYDGATVRLPDAKGLRDLAVLLGVPGREVRSTDLIGSVVTEPDTGPVLDAQARRAYERRIKELRADLDEAAERGDQSGTDKARLELEFLLDQLSGATGLLGRDRRGGGTGEKARSAVGWRVRAAIARIVAAHPALGEHLRTSVQTGAWCCYRPDRPVHWECEATPSGPSRRLPPQV